jgi:N-acetylmuramoyl-L-alanine amidase
MTYGHAEEPELYAPIIPELTRLQVTFQRHGESYAVSFQGRKVGDWPIIRSREDVPETGEDPCVLVLGGQAFVPVRKLSELLPIDIKWDKQNNLVALVPGSEKPRPPVVKNPRLPVTPGSRPIGVPHGQTDITLTGLTVEQGEKGLRIRIQSTGRVQPNQFNLKSPPRIVLDFPGATWSDGVQAPAAEGAVRLFRVGHFTSTTARLVLELSTPKAKLTEMRISEGEIMASVGQGGRVAQAFPTRAPSDPDSEIARLIPRRNDPLAQKGSRGGGPLDGSLLPGHPPIRGRVIQPGRFLQGRIICVDAGHGGHSTGAKGLENMEKDICLKMCQALQRELKERGATVVMTRSDDSYVGLDERCDIANRSNADLFISIHLNSTPTRNSASGTETYWHTSGSFTLAQILHRRVNEAVGREDRGIRNRGFYVIRNTNMPSVLLEIAFINNESDEHLLASQDLQQGLAEQLADGVVEYFNGGQ